MNEETEFSAREFVGWFIRGLVFAAIMIGFAFLIFGT